LDENDIDVSKKPVGGAKGTLLVHTGRCVFQEREVRRERILTEIQPQREGSRGWWVIWSEKKSQSLVGPQCARSGWVTALGQTKPFDGGGGQSWPSPEVC